MMIGCSLLRRCRLLGVLGWLLLLSSCGGDAEVAVRPPGGGGPGPQVAGQVRLPNGELASIPSLLERLAGQIVAQARAITGAGVRPVGRNVIVDLIEVEASDVVDQAIPPGLPLLVSTSTNDDGQYQVNLPENTTPETDRFLVQVGERSQRTRAFVFGSTIDIDHNSEATVRLILGQIQGSVTLDVFTASDIRRIYSAVVAVPGSITCTSVVQCNEAATEAARSDPRVREALQLAAGPAAVLAISIGAADATITVGDASLFPTSGVIEIDDELIAFSGRTGNTLTGLTRGASGTIPSLHNAGAIVNLLPPIGPTATPTPSASRTATITGSPAPTSTRAPTQTPAPSSTPPPGGTETPVPSATAEPSDTPLPSPTPTPIPSSTPVPSDTPTAVPSSTPSPRPTETFTATPIPTSTPTETFTATATSSPTRTPTPTRTPAPPEILIGSVSGAAGATVMVPFSLTSNGFDMSAVALNIGYDERLLEAVTVGGVPDCEVDSSIAGFKRVVASQPDVDVGPNIRIVHIGVIGRDNNTELPDGTLGSCRFRISADAATQTVTLPNIGPDASTPFGERIQPRGRDGSVQITGAPPAIGLADVTAAAGASVAVEATFRARGQSLSALSGLITFDPALLSVATNGSGDPDCVVADAIGAGTQFDKEVFARVIDVGGAQALNVGVIGRDNNELLPDGAVFRCTFVVAGNAGPQTIVLAIEPDGSDPDGDRVGIAGDNGSITVP